MLAGVREASKPDANAFGNDAKALGNLVKKQSRKKRKARTMYRGVDQHA